MSPNHEPSTDGRAATSTASSTASRSGRSAAGSSRGAGPFSLSTLIVNATAVLSLAGRVDLTALPTCRRAVDGLLHNGVVQITVDLQVAHFDDESIALLALMRRYAARHGARLTLADIPPQVARVLDRTGVAWLYRSEGPFSADSPAARDACT